MASGLSIWLHCSIAPKIDMINNFFLPSNIDWNAGCRDVADYLFRNMNTKWTDRDGSTLLHLACQ